MLVLSDKKGVKRVGFKKSAIIIISLIALVFIGLLIGGAKMY